VGPIGQYALALGALALAGCGPGAGRLALRGEPIAARDLVRLYPCSARRNVTARLLEKTERSSRHLICIRDREQPHIHAAHDLVVTLLEGRGTLWRDGNPVPMQPGDTAAVDAGTVHYFVNEGREPARAFVVFSPAFDGTDQLPPNR